ncbi:MAG: ParB N-terminal domain-containing protein [Formivibrio sp.]|nr:ParB N-terminal domain-containing protein [Formivibrio sp.]
MEVRILKISPERLVLDPNNYRFHDLPGYRPVAQRTRYSEPGVQAKALSYLQDTESFELNTLKDSIRSNGFVPLDQIVVEKLSGEGDDTLYLVIEGNRRAAAVKALISDHQAGGDVSEAVLASLQTLPVMEITGTDEERRDYQKTLMAIRHVAGITEWGPYQQARLVVELYEGQVHAFGAVAQRIGISNKEVARRYRASKALQQMETDEEFGDYATPKLYVFFHEAVSQPKVREWLEFSDETYTAVNEAARRTFYELLSPRKIEGITVPPKLQNASVQVRQLKEIVDKEYPLSILADPEKTFDDAMTAANTETPGDEKGILENALGSALQALRRPGIDAWDQPTERAKALWAEIIKIVEKGKKLIEE